MSNKSEFNLRIITCDYLSIMLSWNSQDVMATLDVGEKTFTYSVISRVNYRNLGGGKYEATRDAEVEGLYRLLR